MIHQQSDLIQEGLNKIAQLTTMIARVEQVNPARPEISRYYVKSTMLYAILEQLIAADSLIVYMQPVLRKQLEMELKRIIKTNT